MSVEFKLNLVARADKGKGASRRLRRSEMVPGIIYGGGKASAAVAINLKEITHKLENEAFYSHILDAVVEGGAVEKVVLKDLQRHPSKSRIEHFDLMRISATDKITMNVPLHFLGEDVAPGVKLQSGNVSHHAIDVEISCLPKDLPEYIEVDLSHLNVGDSVHLSDLKLPAGVTIVALTHGAEHDQPVASIHLPRSAKEAGEGEAGGEAAAAG